MSVDKATLGWVASQALRSHEGEQKRCHGLLGEKGIRHQAHGRSGKTVRVLCLRCLLIA